MFHLTISQIGFGKEKRWAQLELLLRSFLLLQYRLFWQRRGGLQERGESSGGCIDQPEEWRGRQEGSRPDQYTTE